MDYISDRKGERFPVIGAPDCSSVIYNSTPVWMADRIGDVTRKDGRSFHHFIFTTETGREAARIISDYELRRPGAGRRI
jgi:putative protease